MKIVIDIPKEFESHFERDRFDDSLCRLRTDAHCVAEKYEKELCDMLIEAFNNGTPLPKGHGRIVDIGQIDKDKIEKDNPIICLTDRDGVYLEVVSLDYLDSLPTIIEADKEGNG